MRSIATVATRPPATLLAMAVPARSIWDTSQPPKNIAEAVGLARERGDLQGQVALRDWIFLFELYHAGGASDP
nr:hypothetical protein GCM10020185_31250 [Pseudomonas brassicacearum subsp. brassicacearum]